MTSLEMLLERFMCKGIILDEANNKKHFELLKNVLLIYVSCINVRLLMLKKMYSCVKYMGFDHKRLHLMF